jgi:hypothetical protein
MALNAEEFIRRFLLHVIPKNFMRVRHYAFLAISFYTVQTPDAQLAIALGAEQAGGRQFTDTPRFCCENTASQALLIADQKVPAYP